MDIVVLVGLFVALACITFYYAPLNMALPPAVFDHLLPTGNAAGAGGKLESLVLAASACRFSGAFLCPLVRFPTQDQRLNPTQRRSFDLLEGHDTNRGRYHYYHRDARGRYQAALAKRRRAATARAYAGVWKYPAQSVGRRPGRQY